MSQLLIGGTGAINSHGRITGSHQYPLMNMQIKARQIKYQAYAIKSLHAKMKIDFSKQGHSIINLIGDQITAYNLHIKHVEINGSGATGTQKTNIKLDLPRHKIHLAFSGQYKNQQWRGDHP